MEKEGIDYDNATAVVCRTTMLNAKLYGGEKIC